MSPTRLFHRRLQKSSLKEMRKSESDSTFPQAFTRVECRLRLDTRLFRLDTRCLALLATYRVLNPRTPRRYHPMKFFPVFFEIIPLAKLPYRGIILTLSRDIRICHDVKSLGQWSEILFLQLFVNYLGAG